jgi:hypothetical protein
MDPNSSRDMTIKAAIALMGSSANPRVFNWVGPSDPSPATSTEIAKRAAPTGPALESERRIWILPPPREYRSPR